MRSVRTAVAARPSVHMRTSLASFDQRKVKLELELLVSGSLKLSAAPSSDAVPMSIRWCARPCACQYTLAPIAASSSSAEIIVRGANILVARMALGSYRFAPSYHPLPLLANRRSLRRHELLLT